eukprot:TRINITY_DN17092_c0_g1_i5.p1 TRINITY_DN17092_c0_g1~~TRINITY_DN17092_c0_g1_i5.p1  ORF type:complete len:220 (+),score=63.51 TRINITY_DN17092_c0_g1_i5:522-1181(+)
MVRARKKGDKAEIVVEDTGVGINEKDLPHIFEEFCSFASHQHLNPNGTGLGLYLAKNFARLMDGTITVKSAYGEGTKFTLSLPLAESQTEATVSDQKTMEYLEVTENGTITQENTIKESENTLLDELFEEKYEKDAAVLVVDDDSINSYVISKMLLRHSIKAERAMNGKEALDLINDKSKGRVYSLVFMDINMPVMSGVEVFSWRPIGCKPAEGGNENQ